MGADSNRLKVITGFRTLLPVLLICRIATGQTTSLTRIPSVFAGEEGIIVCIKSPPESRYPEGAPVVVYQVGGFQRSGIGSTDAGLTSQGFIEIAFNYPGNDDPARQSGGS